MPKSSSWPHDIPRVIAGRYAVRGKIGSGGFGDVWLVLDKRTERLCALKRLYPDLVRNKSAFTRFQKEIPLANKVKSNRILSIDDSGVVSDGNICWYVTEYIPRGSADAYGKFDWNAFIQIISDVASALDAAHGANIVHRDVKPSNILLEYDDVNENYRALLTDFGIAKNFAETLALTETGDRPGSVAYSSPEQMSGLILKGPYKGRSDQFSLACTAYELLTGERLYSNDPSHARGKVPSVYKVRKDIPSGADKVLRKALSDDPIDRYETCVQFSNALKSLEWNQHNIKNVKIFHSIPWKIALKAASVMAAIGVTATMTWTFTHRQSTSLTLDGDGSQVLTPNFQTPTSSLQVPMFNHALPTWKDPEISPTGPIVVGFTNLPRSQPGYIALDENDDVYIAIGTTVKKMTSDESGKSIEISLRFPSLREATGITVDDYGAVYVSDISGDVFKLEADDQYPSHILKLEGQYAHDLVWSSNTLAYLTNNTEYVCVIPSETRTGMENGHPLQSGLCSPVPFEPGSMAVASDGTAYVSGRDRSNLKAKIAITEGDFTNFTVIDSSDQINDLDVGENGILYFSSKMSPIIFSMRSWESGSQFYSAHTKDFLPGDIAVSKSGLVYSTIATPSGKDVWRFPEMSLQSRCGDPRWRASMGAWGDEICR